MRCLARLDPLDATAGREISMMHVGWIFAHFRYCLRFVCSQGICDIGGIGDHKSSSDSPSARGRPESLCQQRLVMCAIEHDEDSALCQLICQVILLVFRTSVHSNLSQCRIILTVTKAPEIEMQRCRVHCHSAPRQLQPPRISNTQKSSNSSGSRGSSS